MIAVERFKRRPRKDASAVAAFLARHAFPLSEDGLTTLVYRGEADGVAMRHWIYSRPETMPLDRIRTTDLWYLTVELPPSSRIEYKFEVRQGEHTSLVLDPLNPRIARDPFGGNSVIETDGYERPAWVVPRPHVPEGESDVVLVPSAVWGEDRAITLYRAATLRGGGPQPLLVVHDGDDYRRYAGVLTVIDNLTDLGVIAPPLLALIDAGDRLAEYAADPRHADHVFDEVVPAVATHHEISGVGLMGASFGAVAALSTAWRRQGEVSRLLLQSGSFAFAGLTRRLRSAPFAPVIDWMREFRRRPGRPAAWIHQDCGIYESLVNENRSLRPILETTGAALQYVEARDGHNWENWRDRLREALAFLYPGPAIESSGTLSASGGDTWSRPSD